MAGSAGSTIETLNGWAAITRYDALLGYFPTKAEAEAEVRRFHSETQAEATQVVEPVDGEL